MTPYFKPFNNDVLVETMRACKEMGIARNTLYSWAKDWGFVQVKTKCCKKAKWRGSDLNKMMLYKL